MLLLIDNYDSFTYNLAQYFGELKESVRVERNDAITVDEIVQLAPERIVLSPGPCTPNEAGISLELIARLAGKFPILGVCLGHQAIGQVYGGRIVRAGVVMHGKVSPILHDRRGVFSELGNPFEATRYHSLAIDRDSVPESLEVSARTHDGEIMGVRHREFAKSHAPLEGVQFHPESIMCIEGKCLLKNFLQMSEA